MASGSVCHLWRLPLSQIVVGQHFYPTGRVGPVVQSLRWRKPRFKPKAKSKLFYVREPTPLDPEERDEMFGMFASYKTKMRAIRTFLTSLQLENKKMKEKYEKMMGLSRDAADELMTLLDENNKWNQAVAKIRETRISDEERAATEKWERIRIKKEEEELLRLQAAEKEMLREKEQSKTFITLQSLDVEIEKLMSCRKDYDFAIDAEGNKISKEENTTTEIKEQLKS